MILTDQPPPPHSITSFTYFDNSLLKHCKEELKGFSFLEQSYSSFLVSESIGSYTCDEHFKCFQEHRFIVISNDHNIGEDPCQGVSEIIELLNKVCLTVPRRGAMIFTSRTVIYHNSKASLVPLFVKTWIVL